VSPRHHHRHRHQGVAGIPAFHNNNNNKSDTSGVGPSSLSPTKGKKNTSCRFLGSIYSCCRLLLYCSVYPHPPVCVCVFVRVNVRAWVQV
jgi:hypothetical protein